MKGWEHGQIVYFGEVFSVFSVSIEGFRTSGVFIMQMSINREKEKLQGCLPNMKIIFIEIRRSLYHLIFIIELPYPERLSL